MEDLRNLADLNTERSSALTKANKQTKNSFYQKCLIQSMTFPGFFHLPLLVNHFQALFKISCFINFAQHEMTAVEKRANWHQMSEI